jgi:hypothetical protein
MTKHIGRCVLRTLPELTFYLDKGNRKFLPFRIVLYTYAQIAQIKEK